MKIYTHEVYYDSFGGIHEILIVCHEDEWCICIDGIFCDFTTKLELLDFKDEFVKKSCWRKSIITTSA